MVMRILHFADLHLGVETYGYIDPTTGLSSRFSDFLCALDEVIDYAVDSDIDLVIFCGDAYRSRDPSQTCQREFAKRVKRLSSHNIPLFLLAGNHDLPNAVGRATAVEIFDTLSVANVTVAGRPNSYCINTCKGPLQIIALPWLRRGILLSRDEYKNLTVEKINEKIETLLTQWLNAEAEKLDPGIPAILAGHLTHSGALSGSERTMVMGRDYMLLQSSISNPVFDYVALGHMHHRQMVECPMPLVYSGSLQTIDFGDEGEEKGFYTVEINRAAPRGTRLQEYEFHPVKTRSFLTIRIDANTDNPAGAVLRAIEKNEIVGAIVRLYISLPADKQGLITEKDIRRALKDAYFVAAINKETGEERRYRTDVYAEALTPLEALKRYFYARKVPEERVKILLEYSERLIQQGQIRVIL